MPMTKLDLKHEFKALYTASLEPRLVQVPELAFLMIDGVGDPNTGSEFPAAVGALYAFAYPLKFAVKRLPDGIDYGVMPLEGLWWAPSPAAFTEDDRSAWEWTAMIMQPDVVTEALFDAVLARTGAKSPSEAISRVRLERLAEGSAAQVMHIGPYAAEAPTIARLHAFIAEQGLELAGKHHEIYLGDPRRTAPEKLKTIIRQPVGPARRA